MISLESRTGIGIGRTRRPAALNPQWQVSGCKYFDCADRVVCFGWASIYFIWRRARNIHSAKKYPWPQLQLNAPTVARRLSVVKCLPLDYYGFLLQPSQLLLCSAALLLCRYSASASWLRIWQRCWLWYGTNSRTQRRNPAAAWWVLNKCLWLWRRWPNSTRRRRALCTEH